MDNLGVVGPGFGKLGTGGSGFILPPTPPIDIKDMSELNEFLLKQKVIIEAQIKAWGKLFDVKELLGNQISGSIVLMEEEANVIDDATGLIEQYRNEMDLLGMSMQRVADAIGFAFADMVTGVSMSLGNLLTSTGIFAQQMLMMIAQIAQQIGKTFIAIGTGLALVPGTRGQGLALIAQGAILTTLGQIGSNLINQDIAANIAKGAAQQSATQELVVAKIDNKYIHLANRRGANNQTGVT